MPEATHRHDSASPAFSRKTSRCGSESASSFSGTWPRSASTCSSKRCRSTSSIDALATATSTLCLPSSSSATAPSRPYYLLAFTEPAKCLGIQERGNGSALWIGIRRASNDAEYRAGISHNSSSRRSTILRPSFWRSARQPARSASDSRSSHLRAATFCQRSPTGAWPRVAEDRRIEADHLALRAPARCRGNSAAARVRRGLDLLTPRRHAAIRHHRQRKRRAAGCRTDRSLRPDERRHSAIGRRQPRQTRTSQQWQQDRILKNAVLDFPEFREITLYDAAGAQLASSRVGQSKLQFPQSGTSFGPNITLSPIGIDDDFLPTAVVGIKLAQLGQNCRFARRRNQPRRNVADGRSDSRRRPGLRARRRRQRTADRARQLQREAARGARRQSRHPAARPPRARPAQRRTGFARVRQRRRRPDARRRRAARAARAGR